MKNKFIKTIGFILLVLYIAWFIFLIYQALLPNYKSTNESNKITEFLEEKTNVKETISTIVPVDDFHPFSSYVRKTIGHYGAYGILGLLGTLSMICLTANSLIGILINLAVGILTCTTTELLQIISYGRGPSIIDCVLDFEGYLTVAILTNILIFFIVDVLINKKIMSSIFEKFTVYFLTTATIEILFLILYKHNEFYLIPNLLFIISSIASLLIFILLITINSLYQKRIKSKQ